MVILNTCHFEGFDLPQEIKFQSITFIEKFDYTSGFWTQIEVHRTTNIMQNFSTEIALQSLLSPCLHVDLIKLSIYTRITS